MADVSETVLLSLLVAVVVTLASKTVELCLTRSSCAGTVRLLPDGGVAPTPPGTAADGSDAGHCA